MKKYKRTLITLMIIPVLSFSGCGPIVGGFINNIVKPLTPPPFIEAEHKFADKTVLIWVDELENTGISGIARREIALQLEEELREHKAAGSVIGHKHVRGFRMTNPKYAQMTIQQLGQKFEADEVLYILVEKFTLEHEHQPDWYQPSSRVHTKVIDAASGDRLWPIAQTRNTLTIDEPVRQSKSPTIRNRLSKEMARSLGQQIAKFFYGHKGEK